MSINVSSQFSAASNKATPLFGGNISSAMKVADAFDAAHTVGQRIDYAFESGRYVSPDVINITYNQGLIGGPTTTDVASN